MIATIIAEIAAVHGMRPADITGRSRKRPFVLARQHAMWRVYNQTVMSLPKIGRMFKRDHTTVLHGIRQHQKRLDDDRRQLNRY